MTFGLLPTQVSLHLGKLFIQGFDLVNVGCLDLYVEQKSYFGDHCNLIVYFVDLFVLQLQFGLLLLAQFSELCDHQILLLQVGYMVALQGQL